MNNINEYNRMLQKDPEDFRAFFGRGVAYYEMGEYDKALEDIKEVLDIYPDFNEAYYYLSSIYEKINSNN